MRLKLLTPTHVLIDEPVGKVIGEGDHGSFCLLPSHIDFLSVLVPGLLIFHDAAGTERFAAIDESVLVKQGEEVLVSTRQAICGSGLEALRQTVREEFLRLDDRERVAKSATAKLEASFLRRYLELAEASR